MMNKTDNTPSYKDESEDSRYLDEIDEIDELDRILNAPLSSKGNAQEHSIADDSTQQLGEDFNTAQEKTGGKTVHLIPLKFYIDHDRNMPLKPTSDDVPYPKNLVLWDDRANHPKYSEMNRFEFITSQWGEAIDKGMSLNKIKKKEPKFIASFTQYCKRNNINVNEYLPPSLQDIAESEEVYINSRFKDWELDIAIRIGDRKRSRKHYSYDPKTKYVKS